MQDDETTTQRIRRARNVLAELGAVEKIILLDSLRMEIELLRLDVPPSPTTTAPRAAIAAPAPTAHPATAAAPSLRVVRGGGRQPSDDFAALPGSWKAQS